MGNVDRVKGGSPETVLRPAARVLLIDPDDRTLLFQAAPFWEDRQTLNPAGFWFTPGGALDPGESHVQAAIREVYEETAIRMQPEDLLGPVWRRRHRFVFEGKPTDQRELYFVCRLAARAAVDGSHDPSDGVDFHAAHRWWHVDEIARSHERFAPARLARFLRPVLAGDLPAEPVDVGV